MHRITVSLSLSAVLFLSLASPALGVVVGNQATGPSILDIVEMDNGDGSYTYRISINLNDPATENNGAVIETWVMAATSGGLHQNYLTDPNVIISNGGNASVKTTSAQDSLAFAVDITGDPYDAATDSVFNDAVFFAPVVGGATDQPQSDPGAVGDGVNGMTAVFVSNDGFYGGPIPGDEFIPIWHVTTWGRGLSVGGELLASVDQTDGTFLFNYVPEPSSAILAGLGALVMVARARRRRR